MRAPTLRDVAAAAAVHVTIALTDLQARTGCGEVLGSTATGTVLSPEVLRRIEELSTSHGLRVGNGLTGMRERLQAIGGDVEAHGGAQRGVQLSAWLPIVPDAVAPA